MADCKIDGEVNSGSQQQWFSRNAQWGNWRGGIWNMVFVGTTNPPDGTWPFKPYTVVQETPIIGEKPYLFVDGGGHYFVMVPSLNSHGSQGISWADGTTSGKPIPIDQFFLAHPDKDNADSINAALDAGKNLLFTPGIYHLESSIRVTRPDTVVLGLGYPTLVPDAGLPRWWFPMSMGSKWEACSSKRARSNHRRCWRSGNRAMRHPIQPTLFSFTTFSAGPEARTPERQARWSPSNPTMSSATISGSGARTMAKGPRWNSNKVRNGLIVNGNNVTLYGLFVEHCQEYQTIWNGNGGRVYFYQSEMPYDPPSQVAWSHGGVRGYASYKVGDAVTTHEAWGLGVYCLFLRAP